MAAAGCSAGEPATSPGNSREETPAAHAQPFRTPPACSFVPARQQLRQLYRQKFCPDLLLRKRQYSTETLASSGYSEREFRFYPFNACPATCNGEAGARRNASPAGEACQGFRAAGPACGVAEVPPCPPHLSCKKQIHRVLDVN